MAGMKGNWANSSLSNSSRPAGEERPGPMDTKLTNVKQPHKSMAISDDLDLPDDDDPSEGDVRLQTPFVSSYWVS